MNFVLKSSCNKKNIVDPTAAILLLFHYLPEHNHNTLKHVSLLSPGKVNQSSD
jgi:hypothetical protein